MIWADGTKKAQLNITYTKSNFIRLETQENEKCVAESNCMINKGHIVRAIYCLLFRLLSH